MEELDDEEYWKMVEFERSKFYESESNLKWIWGAGLYLGKNMVVTSVVISTVPLILPPLVALSAIGFAFSLPAGFVLATYACTDKLMNTLLPMPPYYLEPAYEENDDIGSEAKELEEDTQKKVELVEEVDNRDKSVDRYEIPVHVDGEPDTWMRVPVIMEDDVGDVESLGSDVPIVIEGIQEADNEISLMEREGVLTPKDTLLAVVVEAEVSEENEGNVEQVTEVLAFVPQTDMRGENSYREELTVAPKGAPKESELNGRFPIKDVFQETGDQILFVIPEEVKSVVIEGTEGLDKTAGERGKGIEQSEVVIEKTEVDLVVNEKEMAGVPTEVQDSLSDLLHKRLRGEDLASDSGIGASTDYLKVRIESISISGHTEIGPDQEITSGFDKALINEEKIWEQINAIRTIIGCKTAAHTSCVEELKVLYEFTGIDLPVSSKDGTDLADVYKKLHFLKSIVGVK